MQEIVSQADYYGLPTPERGALPTQERIAEQLAPPVPWQGPTRLACDEEEPEEDEDER